MFQEIDNVVGGNITGTMTTVEARLSNACGRIERDVYRRLCYACIAPVTFEFVPADFDLCQPFPLCAHTTFSWDNGGNLLTEESIAPRHQRAPRLLGRYRNRRKKEQSSSRNDVMAEPDKKSILRFTLFIRQALGNGSISQAIITVVPWQGIS
ncbi:hypothetical protein K0M31_012486 [Melipona bicolor]|uniref:Uncharacterized protein n=1 Tax=Melipona bicolor TaxID=60889 RepID=A0AA40FKJ1_9HYME|nr:hypothetical protein K0M31_012486 [Melipona bicolor]